jgi:GLPGLI family protein
LRNKSTFSQENRKPIVMKKIFALILFGATMLSAQTNRFIYEYKYIPNIKEKDTVRKDLMALDITDKGSVYQSMSKMERDSIMNVKMELIMKNIQRGSTNLDFSDGKFNRGTVNYTVVKEYPQYAVFLNERISSNQYKISSNKKQEWKISPDKQKIGNYTAQKATTSFGGREWIAWFTTELPFPDGPYKFHGLPGLIIKLEDTTGSHIMTMIANKKIESPKQEKQEKQVGNMQFSLHSKEIPVNEEQFKKAWNNYIKDPSKETREMMGGRDSSDGVSYKIVSTTFNGKELNAKELMKNQEAGVKRMLETNNNRIEPTLYQ